MIKHTTEDGHTTTWLWHKERGRLQITLRVHRHTYSNCSVRWVLQPGLVYDRKPRA